MTMHDLLQTMKPDVYVTIRSYDQKEDDFGETDLFVGYIWELLADEKKSRKIEAKNVHAIDQGLVSLIVGVA